MTGPAWDGQGTDPWLPQRLNALIEAAEVERSIRRAVWAALSDWMVRAARRVLRGSAPPDIDAIHALAPLWRDAVGLIVQGEIKDAVGRSYVRLLGEEFAWDRRPFVTHYLAEARNRLVRIPDEVYGLAAGQISHGVNLGEGIPKLTARVDDVLSTTESERWPNRATTIARTETIGALSAGRHDAFLAFAAEDPDTEYEHLWLATEDGRTRPHHRDADGQRVPLDQPFIVGGFELRFPGDPLGPAQEVINCRCASLLLEKGESVDVTDRQMRSRR